MNKVIFSLQYFNSDTKESSEEKALLSISLDLPFFPQVGLVIRFPGGYEAQIESVKWDATSNQIECALREWFVPLMDDYDLSDYVADLVSDGWALKGVFKNE